MTEAEFNWDAALDMLAIAPVRVERLLSRDPQPGSKATAERTTVSGDAKLLFFLEQTPRRAFASIALAGESIIATTRLLRLPPVEVMAGPVVRAGLIATGLILWMMDPSISPEERVKRTLRVLADDINNAMKVATTSVKVAMPEQLTEAEATVEGVKKNTAALDKTSSGLKRASMLTDERLAILSDSEYEYTLYTHISHGTPSVVDEIRRMFNHTDPSVVGVALVQYLVTLVHAYCQAGWAIGQYILDSDGQKQLKDLLIALYRNLGANDTLYSYLSVSTSW